MKTRNFFSWTIAVAVAAFLFVSGADRAFAVSVPTCNSFDASGNTIYSTAIPPDQTGTTNCTDYFGQGNWANSPLPSSPITGYTLITGGSGYINPLVVITDPNGAGAAASAAVLSGVITGVTVQTQGNGYIVPTISIVDVGTGGTLGVPTCGGVSQPACGSGAMVTAVLGGPYTGGMLKFQDPLADLRTVIATPDTTTFPGSDYYEIALVQYTQQMHSSLPPTTLRGYVQFPSGSTGCSVTPVMPPSYLGPIIVSQKNRAVRVKFTNCLPAGSNGDLFIPTDHTYMGAGTGPGGENYSENRAVLHLHGGVTPWISDGTPHQWTAPVGESSTTLLRGDSVVNVPDMFFDATGLVTPVTQCTATITSNCYPNAIPAGLSNDPGQGSLTYYWTNQQGGRLMFYHDHAYGITRLNVYAGEAAGYLIVDPAEESTLAAATAPGTISNPANLADPANDVAHFIPLVIQDKSFVPAASQIDAQDPTWSPNYGTTPGAANPGDLWFPHIYITNQNPADPGGGNGFGRWDYGAWFFPQMTTLTAATPNTAITIPCTSAAFPGQTLAPTAACPSCGCPIIPNPSGTPEGFMDTPVVNGVAYPVLHVSPEAYRFQILSVGNDRSFNLSWFKGDPSQGLGSNGKPTEVAMIPAVPPARNAATLPLCSSINPVAVPSLTIGLDYALLDATGNPLNGTGLPADCWPNYGPQPGIPPAQTMWAADGRAGGTPDPRTAGPAWVQIGTEGGLLPAPVVIPATPTNYELNMRSITVTSVAVHGLWLGPAERADVIVDFSKFAGQTLILYNDAPAPTPANDSRVDYYTDDGDQTPIGGAPNTPAGYGPNTRTIMQVIVDQPATGAPAFSLPALKAAFASTPTTSGLFETTQPTAIVPEAGYNSAYNGIFPDNYTGIQSETFTFTPLAPQTLDNPCAVQPTPPAVCGTMDRKTIQELFTLDYGRMNATLGVELPLTNFLTQTTIPYGYVDPPTELIREGETQLWKITHNGVDSHFIHFHLFNVQVVNRVGWDGSLRPPDANELGWKETVRMNPLEDILVVMQPITPTLPFPLPDSIRYMDVTGGPTMFTGVDPNNQPVNLTNIPINFGWEYVWHCHILGHEENDMMRPIVFQVAPPAPSSLVATGTGPVQLAWVDNSASEDSYTIQRDTAADFSTMTSIPVTAVNSTGFNTHGYGQTVTFTDPDALPGTTYYYRVQANDSFMPVVSAYPVAFQPRALSSGWSNIASTAPAAIISVAPTSLAFGSLPLNTTSAPQSVTLSNIGSADLLISGFTITGDYLVSANTCSTTVAAGTSCSISMTFTPTVMGARSGSLTIDSNSAINPTLSVQLSGTGLAAVAGVAPVLLDFGNQMLNTVSTAQTVTVSNTGNMAMLISSVTITGTNPGDFAIASTSCGASLAGGANCTISMTFTPTALLGRSASLEIANSDLLHTPLSVSLTGTGTNPAAVVAPLSLAFGNQLLNTVSTAQTVTLSNTGTTALLISGITVTGTNPGDFLVSANTCTASLAAGGNCAISVTFTPAALGARAGTLSIASNDPANPVIPVGLTGTGVTPVAGVAPTSLVFGNQLLNTTSAAQTATLSNTGTADLLVSSITITGANAGDFLISANTCTASLGIGGNCAISVTFTPNALLGRTASLVIANSDPVNPSLTVGMSGTGAVPIAGVAPTTLLFADQLLNTTSAAQTVTVSNTGSADLLISGVTITGTNPGDFAILSSTCGTSLAIGGNCAIGLTFTPTAALAGRSASLAIGTNDPAHATLAVSMTGNGVVPLAGIAPTALAFGDQLQNTPSTAQTMTVSNTGSAVLTITGITVTGTNPGDFALSSACSSTLGIGANCSISVTFTPAAVGARAATLTVANNDPAHAALTAALTGNGIAPVAGIAPAGLVFVGQLLNTPSTAQTVTLSNTGGAPLVINSITVAGANPGDFALTNGCVSPLGIGASCGVGVTFTPSATGPRAASLVFSTSDPVHPALSAPLSGTGIVPVASVVPTSLVFGTQLANTTSGAQTVTLANAGTAPLTITGIALSGADPGSFAQTNACVSPLAPGSNCAISVTFTPTVAALGISASLDISTSDPANPVKSVSLTGTGTAISLSPAVMFFGNQLVGTSSTTRSATLINTGATAMAITGITVTGANPADFLMNTTCGTSLSAGRSCTISVRFRPSTAGAESAVITVSDADPASPQTITLTGTGVASIAAVSPPSLSFGAVTRGQVSGAQLVTVSNNGNAPFSFNSTRAFTLGGASASSFAVATGGSCVNGGTLTGGSSCTVSVTFRPSTRTSPGAKSATLIIRDNASNSTTQTVDLTGTAQ